MKMCREVFKNVKAFKSCLQQIFGMLKYNRNKTELYTYVKENIEVLSSMNETEYRALLTLLGEQKRLLRLFREKEEKGEKIDMCKAIDNLIEDGKLRANLKKTVLCRPQHSFL